MTLKQLPLYVKDLIKYQQTLASMNGIQLTSWQALGAGISTATKAMLKWLTTTPVGWATLAIGAIAGVVGIYDLLTTSTEEASEATIDAIGELSSITSEVETLEGKLADLKAQIDGLDPITDEEDIRRLEAESLELENQLAILKEKQRLATEDADEKAQESLGKKQASRYNEPKGQSRTENGYVQESFDGSNEVTNYQEVTREEELKNAMNAYDEYYKQRLALEAELAKMSADNKGYKEKENQINLLNQQMRDARTHASELALALDEEKDGLSGTTAESKALLDSTNATLSSYNQWLNGINGTTNALNENANAIDNATASATKFTKTQMIDTINSMADGFDVLDDIYADVLDGGSFDFTNLDTSKFSEAFSEITHEYEKFIETVSASPTDIEACQGAFNDLVDAYLNSKDVLENLTEENKDLTISMLQNIGIANASDVVTSALDRYTQAQRLSTLAGFDLANASAEEIYALTHLESEFANAGEEAYKYYLNKKLCSETSINTVADCEALIALAKQCQVTGENIALLTKLKNSYAVLEEGSIWGDATKELARKEIESVKSQLSNLSVSANVSANISTKPKYSGAKTTADAIEKANKSASDSAKDAAEKAKDEYNKFYDFMEIRNERLSDSFELLEKGIENVVGAFAKNNLIDAQLGNIEESINNNTDALAMYKKQAENVLSTIDNPELRDKIVNGAVELTDIQGENADQVKSAIEAYNNWNGKIAETAHKLQELRQQLEDLELQKFTNIVEDFNDMFDIRENSKDLLDKQIDLIKESGNLVGESLFSEQISQSQKQLALLEEEKAKLVSQMNESLSSGRVQVGSEAWISMLDHIQEVEESILDVKTNIEELDTELLNLHYEVFEKVQENFDNIGSELDNLAGLFDDELEIKVSDGNGNWTDEALGQLGLLAQNLELSKYRVTEYGKEIEKLSQDYLDGKYTLLEYQEKLAELSQGQWDAVNSAESLEDAIIDLNQTRIDEEIETIEEEIDAYEKLIDTQLELIDETEELRKKREDLAEKSKSVTDIERQLASMQNDDSQATIAKRKLLEEELANAKKDLENAEHEYSVESQKSALEQKLQDYTDARNAEIEQLRLSLENRELLISQSFENVKANASTVGEQIALIAQEHGIVASNAIISPWTQGKNAIASYGEVLSVQSSAFIGNIIGVENEVYNLQNEANVASVALSNMFATRADNLVGQLQASWYTEDNLNYATGILQQSLVNTLERGYNIGGITGALGGIQSGLNGVADAANRAAQAIQNALGSQERRTSIEFGGGNGNKAYRVKDIYSGEVLGSFTDYNTAYDFWKKNKASSQIAMYAKGGVIKKDNNPLTPIANYLGEDTVIVGKEGERVLTQKQNDLFETMVKNLEQNGSSLQWNIPNLVVPNNIPLLEKVNRPNVTLHYDKMYEINGDIYDAHQFENKVAKISKNQTTKILNDINRDFRIHNR